jgi:RNA 2',3'-cyclic 3'-phosphodiesterase
MRQPAPATRRLFFALWPDEAQRAALEHAVARAVRHCGGRPVPVSNLHVTLAFLGSVALARIPELEKIGREVATVLAPHAPISLTFARLAYWKEAQLLCALATPDPAAARVVAATLQDAAATLGLSPDRKPFQAHVTLARKVVQPGVVPRLRPVVWRFDAYALVDSRTEPSGPVYSIVDSYPLVSVDKARD